MSYKKIIYIFTLYTLALCNAITNVAISEENDNIINYEYIPNKGFVVNIENFDLEFENQIKNIDSNKTSDEIDKLNLFETIKMDTPKIWLDQWKNSKSVEDKKLYSKYKKQLSIPNPNNNETVYQLLVMSRNAYVSPNENDWVDLTQFGWDILYPFGWSSDNNDKTANNVRGYIFKNERTKTIVVSIKGTSAGLFGIGGPTAENDKYNDNMMFSCCCAIVDLTWKGICGCHSGINLTCENTCLREEAKSYKNSYYEQLKHVLEHIQEYRIHYGYDVFFTGHSLGGALASLSGLTFFAPVATFEAPGEAQFALRIGINPGVEEYKNLPIYHFGNNGDPIYLGKCTGITSACYYSGFAMETKCHIGKLYTFDLDKNKENNPDENDPENDNPENDNPENDDPSSPTPTTTSAPTSTTIKSPFRNPFRPRPTNKSLINQFNNDDHQLQLFLEKKSEEIKSNDIDHSLKAPNRPSNPGKLNMLHHRVDYVIGLLTNWKGDWPTEEIQDSCIDCENWTFIEREGDEGRTDPPSF